MSDEKLNIVVSKLWKFQINVGWRQKTNQKQYSAFLFQFSCSSRLNLVLVWISLRVLIELSGEQPLIFLNQVSHLQCTAPQPLQAKKGKTDAEENKNMEVLPATLTSRERSIYFTSHKNMLPIRPVMQIWANFKKPPPKCFGENKRSYADGLRVFWAELISLGSPNSPNKRFTFTLYGTFYRLNSEPKMLWSFHLIQSQSHVFRFCLSWTPCFL